MKNNIRLDIVHPQKSRAESFLNKVSENLEELPFDVQELNGVDDTVSGYKFKVKDRSTFVILIFAESYAHANEIAAANSQIQAKLKWTINGALLFGVESVDAHLSNQMLSFFAGQE